MTASTRRLATAAALTLTMVILSGGAARATEVGYSRHIGVGAMFGDPTGLSAKFWTGNTNAIDLGVGFYGYGFRGGCYRDRPDHQVCDRRYANGRLSLNADYLWESKLIQGGAAQLDWHIGAGGRVFFIGEPCAYDCWNAGVRMPLGLDLTFARPNFLELFLEIAPIVYVAPGLFLSMEGGFGVRAYF
jgi:hypothetical protein